MRLLDITYVQGVLSKVEDFEEALRSAVELKMNPILTENCELEKGIQERLLDFVVRKRYPVSINRSIYMKRKELGFENSNDHWLVA